MEEINLEFFGPYPLASEEKDILSDCEFADKSGIYIWTVRLENNVHKITYIGETYRSFYTRTKEHVLHQFSGYYSIYDPELLAKGILKFAWNGLWGKGRKNKLPEYLANYNKYAPMNLEYIKMQSIFVAPINVDKKIIVKIEGALAKELRNNNEASALLDKNIRYNYLNEVKENLLVKIKTPLVIAGIPKELII